MMAEAGTRPPNCWLKPLSLRPDGSTPAAASSVSDQGLLDMPDAVWAKLLLHLNTSPLELRYVEGCPVGSRGRALAAVSRTCCTLRDTARSTCIQARYLLKDNPGAEAAGAHLHSLQACTVLHLQFPTSATSWPSNASYVKGNKHRGGILSALTRMTAGLQLIRAMCRYEEANVMEPAYTPMLCAFAKAASPSALANIRELYIDLGSMDFEAVEALCAAMPRLSALVVRPGCFYWPCEMVNQISSFSVGPDSGGVARSQQLLASRCSGLRHLTMAVPGFGATHLSALGNLQQLQSLDLVEKLLNGGSQGKGASVTQSPATMQVLSGLTSLKRLSLTYAGSHIAAGVMHLAALSTLPGLTHLSVTSLVPNRPLVLGNPAMAALASLPALEHLTADGVLLLGPDKGSVYVPGGWGGFSFHRLGAYSDEYDEDGQFDYNHYGGSSPEDLGETAWSLPRLASLELVNPCLTGSVQDMALFAARCLNLVQLRSARQPRLVLHCGDEDTMQYDLISFAQLDARGLLREMCIKVMDHDMLVCAYKAMRQTQLVAQSKSRQRRQQQPPAASPAYSMPVLSSATQLYLESASITAEHVPALAALFPNVELVHCEGAASVPPLLHMPHLRAVQLIGAPGDSGLAGVMDTVVGTGLRMPPGRTLELRIWRGPKAQDAVVDARRAAALANRGLRLNIL